MGSSKFGLAKFGDGITYRALKDALDALNRSKKNNPNDALIGELAIKNGFTLLTADNDLKAVANPDPNARLRQTLEELGEVTVRLKNAQHEWGGLGTAGYAFVSEWLREIEVARADARDSDTRALARRANTIAIIAAIIAIISIIATIIIAVIK